MFALKIWTEKGRKTTFYSVFKEDGAESETNRFFRKYKDIKEYRESIQKLMQLLVNSIGNKHGAKAAFFNRNEEGSFGLPPKKRQWIEKIEFHFPDFPLRLYAIRIREREDLVVLFNGGVKKSQKNIDSDALHISMQEAKIFARRIDKALQCGEIIINEEKRELQNEFGGEEIILY